MITESSTIAVMEEAQRLRRQGIDVIDLGPGEPDFGTPEPICRAAVEAIESGFTKYTSAGGTLELRRAIAERFNRHWNSDFSEANVVVCCGAKHAIYNVVTACFEAGDEVIIPAPYWVTFPEVVKMAEARPVYVETSPDDGFVLDIEAVRASITPRTRGLILNSPGNPTGAVLPESTMRGLYELCREHEILLLSDETYEYFVYDGHRHVSAAAAVSPDDRSFAIVGSLSKTYSMTGWRVGFCIAHTELIRKMIEFQSHQTGNPTSISQKAAMAALALDLRHVTGMKTEYEARRELVVSALAEMEGFRCQPPHGAFYAFPEVTGAMAAAGIHTSQGFSKFLIQEARVATVPGSAFGMEGFIRLSYATSRENLTEGLKRIRQAVDRAALKPSQ